MAENTHDNIKINEPEDIKVSRNANTFRISYSETDMFIDFGFLKEINPEQKEIEIVAKVALPVLRIKDLIGSLIDVSRQYDTAYDVDLLGIRSKE